jgi:hypothetical protein
MKLDFHGSSHRFSLNSSAFVLLQSFITQGDYQYSTIGSYIALARGPSNGARVKLVYYFQQAARAS